MAQRKLSKSQVQAAFKRARAHFHGKIPKGTKLARFVPGHHKSRVGRPANRTSNRSTHRSARRIVSGVRSRVRRHPKATTAIINVAEGLIAFNQGISKAIGPAMSGNAQEAFRQFVFGETGMDIENPTNIQFQQTGASAASKVLAIVWGKAAKYFTRRMRI